MAGRSQRLGSGRGECQRRAAASGEVRRPSAAEDGPTDSSRAGGRWQPRPRRRHHDAAAVASVAAARGAPGRRCNGGGTG
eukprot:7653436-Alexandrium_andersonii.AAC.1